MGCTATDVCLEPIGDRGRGVRVALRPFPVHVGVGPEACVFGIFGLVVIGLQSEGIGPDRELERYGVICTRS